MAFLLAESPALPLHEAGKYVAAAYVVLFAMVLLYVAIMAIRLSRIERELGELLQALDDEDRGGPAAATAAAGSTAPQGGGAKTGAGL